MLLVDKGHISQVLAQNALDVLQRVLIHADVVCLVLFCALDLGLQSQDVRLEFFVLALSPAQGRLDPLDLIDGVRNSDVLLFLIDLVHGINDRVIIRGETVFGPLTVRHPRRLLLHFLYRREYVVTKVDVLSWYDFARIDRQHLVILLVNVNRHVLLHGKLFTCLCQLHLKAGP